ncbi:MAG TPA: DNA-binding protein [Jatrophihabitantaceae bacterium]|jgi:predicted DNA-binding transcriptional regulator AlpA
MTATLLDVRMELVGPAELTQMLDVSRTRFAQLIARKDFPEPVADLVMGKIWALEDVRAWAAQTGRELQPLTKTKKG